VAYRQEELGQPHILNGGPNVRKKRGDNASPGAEAGGPAVGKSKLHDHSKPIPTHMKKSVTAIHLERCFEKVRNPPRSLGTSELGVLEQEGPWIDRIQAKGIGQGMLGYASVKGNNFTWK